MGHALPKFGIFTVLRESAELEANALKILSAASFHRWFEKDILKRIDFVMTDSASHNLEGFGKIWRWEHPRNTSLQYQSIDDASRKNWRTVSRDTWFFG